MHKKKIIIKKPSYMKLSVDQTQHFRAMKILWEHVTLILAALSRICLMIDFVVIEGCTKSVNFLMFWIEDSW